MPLEIKMAMIYKKPPLALYNKGWNEKTLPKETSKMQNKDTRFKMKAGYGASLGGSLCYIHNPTLGLFSRTF